MEIESRELEEYVRASITATKSGGLKIYVAKAEVKLKSEEISHLKFHVRPNPTGSVRSPSYAQSKSNPAV